MEQHLFIDYSAYPASLYASLRIHLQLGYHVPAVYNDIRLHPCGSSLSPAKTPLHSGGLRRSPNRTSTGSLDEMPKAPTYLRQLANTIVYDLPPVLSKFLHVGLSLSEVIERSTINPAAVLGLSESIGTLKPGAEGDVAIFRLDEGRHALWDNLSSIRVQRTINKLLVPVNVIKAGRVVR